MIGDFKDWILEKINAFIAVLNSFITAMWTTVTTFFKSLVLTLQDMFKDIFYWAFEAVMDLLTVILDGLGSLIQLIDITYMVSGLPDEVLNMMGLLGLGECLGFIGTAILIRITLQLIPFTRLGS